MLLPKSLASGSLLLLGLLAAPISALDIEWWRDLHVTGSSVRVVSTQMETVRLGASRTVLQLSKMTADGAALTQISHLRFVGEVEIEYEGIEFHAYDGLPHSASAEEIDELKAFLAKVIPAQE